MKHQHILVENWKQGWKWFSNIALASIVVINTTPIPPELVQALPPQTQQHLTIALAITGLIGRFINQSKRQNKKKS